MNKQFIKKIVLGTAQLGNSNYGISSNKKGLNDFQKLSILEYSWELGIRNYDTAGSYGSYNILKKFIEKTKINKKIKIITKVPKLKSNNFRKKFIEEIKFVKKSLNINKIECLFFHSQENLELIIKNINFLRRQKKIFNINKLGISIYDLKYGRLAQKLIRDFSIQFPYNLVNDSFNKLKNSKISYYARSIFLQGLLSEKKIIKSVNKDLLISKKNYEEYIARERINKIQLCLNFVNLNKNIDFFVIGVKNKLQLKQILNIEINKVNLDKAKKIQKFFNKRNCDPRKW